MTEKTPPIGLSSPAAALRDESKQAAQPKRASSPKRRRLTLPLFSLKHKPHLIIEVTAPFVSAHMPALSKNDDGTVSVLPCIDVETGEEGMLLAYTMVQSAIERSSPEYVGRTYEIERGEKVPGKDYYQVDVYELTE